MRLSVRYDNKFQIIELNEKETEEMWISLSLEGDELPNSDKERLIQDAFNEIFNKPEYNNWHKFDRHEYCEQIEPPVRMIEPASAINRATQCNRESH